MNLDTTQYKDAMLITTDAPRIDAAVAVEFKDAMQRATESAAGRVILDLSSVDFLDSSGLGAVVAAMKFLGAGAQLELSGLTPNVEKVFRLTRLDSVLPIHVDAAAALTGLADAS